jgi:hypothetical protein
MIQIKPTLVVRGGLVVIVLAIELNVRGFKPDRERQIFKGEKVRSTTSFGEEVKPAVPCRMIVRNVKDTCGVREIYLAIKINGHFSPSFSLLRCYGSLKVFAREPWWINQE